MHWSMQLTWNEDATVLDDKDDDILLEEEIFMLELSWLEVIDEFRFFTTFSTTVIQTMFLR